MDSSLSVNDAFVLVAGTLSMLLMVLVLIGFAFMFQRRLIKKEMRFKEIEKMLRKEELNSAYALIEGQEQERQRIASDLHDNLGSLFALIKMNAEQIDKSPLTTSSANNLDNLITLLNKALDESRRISHNLDALPLKHFGLSVAINQLFELLNQSGRIKAQCNIYVETRLPNELGLNLYRVVQEMVSNTLKHAMATTITLELNAFNQDFINLIYEDNGLGFSTEEAKNGMGLSNIYKRVEYWGGQVSIESSPNKGTNIIIEIPLKNV